MANTIQVTTQNFASAVIEGSRRCPVLVDFWAAWCAPCRALAPVLDELAARHGDKLCVAKIDSDAEPALAQQYNVRSLPTLLVFRAGRVVETAVGAQPQSALERLLAPHWPRASDTDFASAQEALAAGDLAGALAALERAHALVGDDYRVHPMLATLYLSHGRLEDARALIACLPANLAMADAVQPLVARLRLADAACDVPEDDPTADAYRSAVAAAAAGEFGRAVDGLMALLPRQRDWRDGLVRKTLVDIFNVLGADQRVKAWRTQLARSLN
jgi:putative thioredoxin